MAGGRSKFLLVLNATVLVLLVLLGLALAWITQPRALGRAAFPNGIEMAVVQQFNWFEDPYFSTRFGLRDAQSARWHLFYFEHEDDLWKDARITITNETRAIVFRDGAPVLEVNVGQCANGAVGPEILARLQAHERTISGQVMPLAWELGDSF